jgi:hypothetical protein
MHLRRVDRAFRRRAAAGWARGDRRWHQRVLQLLAGVKQTAVPALSLGRLQLVAVMPPDRARGREGRLDRGRPFGIRAEGARGSLATGLGVEPLTPT